MRNTFFCLGELFTKGVTPMLSLPELKILHQSKPFVFIQEETYDPQMGMSSDEFDVDLFLQSLCCSR